MKKSFKKLVSTLGIMTLFVAPVVTTTMLSVSEQGVQASHKGHKNHKTEWKGIAFKMGQMTPEQADIEFGTRRTHDYPTVFIKSFDKSYSVNFKNRNDKNVEHLIITNYQNK